jgi:hypothetical protein
VNYLHPVNHAVTIGTERGVIAFRVARNHHPAYIRWQRCEDLLARNGRLEFPRDIEAVNTLLVASLDNLSLIQATHGSVDARQLGNLANYGNETVQKRLRAVIWSDSLPNEFATIQLEVQRCLDRFNTSVSGVICSGGCTVLKMTDGSQRVLCFLRYRGILIRHRNPKEPLPEDAEPIMAGYTGMLQVLPGDGS